MTNPTPPPNPNDPNPGGPNTPGLSQDRRVAAYDRQNRHRALLTPRQVGRVIKKQRRLERVGA